jgi:hypothetical protein
MRSTKVAVLVAVLCLAFAGGVVSAGRGVALYVHGRPIAAQGLVQDGVTYLPVRAVAEALGVSVEWDPQARAIYVGNRPTSASVSQSSAAPAVSARKPAPSGQKLQDVVHITRTGKKYHAAGCRHLSRSDIPISREDAIARGYTPCSVCNP